MTPPPDVQRILDWPRETRSDAEHERLREYRASLHNDMYQLVDQAERFDRDLSAEEQERFDALNAEFAGLASEVPSRR